MADRHDDELAERRTSGGRSQRDRGATAGGALPLQWSERAGDPGERQGGETIDLTERAGGDDFAAWSDVLRRRPPEGARLSGHPSAGGERPVIGGAAAGEWSADEDGDDEFAQALLERRRRRGVRRMGRRGRRARGPGDSDEPAPKVSRLYPVAPEPEGPGPDGPAGFGADLVTRVVTGVAVAGACLLAFNAGTGPTAWLVAVIVGLGVLEFCAALRSAGHRPAVPIALAGSVGLVFGAYHSGQSAYPAAVVLVVMSGLLWYLVQVVRGRPVTGMATTLLPFAYVGALGSFAALLLGFENGVGMLLGVAICAVAYDVCGYAAGRRFGKHHISAISPNKTLEGLLAGMAGSLLVAFALVGVITPWDRWTALALGAVVAALAPLGDLCESMLKRDLGVKDFGGLLPGHGGVLDRFDAILFSLPAVYYLVRLLELA